MQNTCVFFQGTQSNENEKGKEQGCMPKWSNRVCNIGISKMKVVFKNIHQCKTQENSKEAIVFTLQHILH